MKGVTGGTFPGLLDSQSFSLFRVSLLHSAFQLDSSNRHLSITQSEFKTFKQTDVNTE